MRGTARIALLVCVLLGCAIDGVAATISGVVRDADTGAPLQASVTITGVADEFVFGPATDTEGRFIATALQPGTYFVTASVAGYVTQTFGSTCTRSWCRASNGTPIVLGSASQSVGIEIAMGRGGTISGTLSAANPLAASGVTVRLYTTAGEYVATASSNAGGQYSLAGLRAGSYYVSFQPGFGTYERQLYPGVRCVGACSLQSGTPVAVAAGAVTGGIDGTLTASTASISGSVTNGSGGFVIVRARDRTTGAGGVAVLGGEAAYTITGLPPGSYSVWIDTAPAGKQRPVYGGPALSCIGSTPSCDAQRFSGAAVTVAPGASVTGIDFVLNPAARISGEIRRASDNQLVTGVVRLFTASAVLAGEVTAPGGAFTIDNLPPGRYYAAADAPALSLGPQVYDGHPCATAACAPLAGTAIDVAAGATAAGVNFALPAAGQGTVTASVRNAAGMPIAGILVQLWNNTDRLSHAGVTNPSGLVSIQAPPGAYYARTDGTYGIGNAQYADEWYGGECVGCGSGKGAPVIVTAAQAAGPIEFVLDAGATASGVIVKPPIFGTVIVEAYSERGVLVRSARCESREACVYSIPGLAPGFYTFVARDITSSPGGRILVDQIYPNVDCAFADCLQVPHSSALLTIAQPLTSVNFSLRVGGRIRGRAAAADLPIATFGVTGFAVAAFDARGVQVGRVLPYFDQFEISGLPAGTYYLRTTNAQPLGYQDEVYDDIPCNGCTVEGGTPVRLGEGAIVEGIELMLDRAAGLEGTVTDGSTGDPLENIEVIVYSAAGTPAGRGTTNPSGRWRVPGLTAGEYFVATSNSRFYVDVVYGAGPCAPCDVTRGQIVTVTPGSPSAAIALALDRGGAIAGSIGDESGVALSQIPVRVQSADGVVLARTTSDSTGRYQVVVPPGTTSVQTEPFGTRTPQTFPQPVVVVAGSLRDGVDFTLPRCNGLRIFWPIGPEIRYLGTSAGTRVQVEGGTPPYAYSLVSGSIPRGWQFDSSLGAALGIATTPGRYAFTIGVVDAAGCGASRLIDLSVESCAPVIDSDTIGVPRHAGTRSVTVRGTCPVEAISNTSWIRVSPSLIGAPGAIAVTFEANPGGSRQGTFSIGPRLIRVNQAGAVTAPPFGMVDAPLDGAAVRGSIAVGGWAIDDVGVERVRIFRDPVSPEPDRLIYIGDAVRVRGARPDVDLLYNALPDHERAGWGYLLLTNMLPDQGNGTFRLHAFASDSEGHEVLLGSRTIVADNRNATQPFGAIDTPAQGETIDGTGYVNYGWALTPLPGTIPADGSTITVIIDGVAAGTVSYNHFRPDVAGLFPGLNNSGGAIGFRAFDTTQLADGVHTIAWVVTDDGGHAEGIGSRYFSVANGAAVRAAAPPVDTAVHAARISRKWRIRSLERLSFDVGLPGCAIDGFEVVGGERRPLPIGSTLDPATGTFSWQPGPGFLGTYDLVFTAPACATAVKEKRFTVTIDR